MNLIILFPEDFIDPSTVRLDDRRYAHIQAVLKPACGDRLKVGMLNGNVGEGCVKLITPEFILIEVTLNQSPPSALPVTLLCALPRPKTLRKVLQASVSMGVKSIYLMRTWRADKSYWQSPLLSESNLQKQCILGLEQARDTILPAIQMRPRFKPFVQDELPSIIKGSNALVAHPQMQASTTHQPYSPVTLAIGPEGGFIPYEIGLLKSIGFKQISLGQRPLRVEHAVVALLAKLF